MAPSTVRKGPPTAGPIRGRGAPPTTTTFFATLALYFFGGEVLRGFSLAMTVGVVIGTYSTIFVAAPILIHLGLRSSTVAGPAKSEPEAVLGVDEAAKLSEVEAEVAEQPVAPVPPKTAGKGSKGGKRPPARPAKA